MDDKFKLIAAARPNEELQERIDNREKYLPETVEASVDELQFRGVGFSDEELKVIAEDMQARRDLAASKPDSYGLFSDRDKNNFIEDPDAPLLFSRRAIYGFSVFFSVVFGSIMLAINVSKIAGKGKAALVVLFGLIYTVVTILIAKTLKLNSGLGVVISLLGAALIETLFWNRFIGNATLYRKRPIWISLAIAVVLAAGLIFVIVKYGQLSK